MLGLNYDGIAPNDDAGELLTALAAQPELRNVVLEYTPVSDAHLRLFVAATQLERLKLERCNTDTGAVAGLTAIVAGCPLLKILELTQFDVGDPDEAGVDYYNLVHGASAADVGAFAAAVAGSRLQELALCNVRAFEPAVAGGLFQDTPGARLLDALRGHATLFALQLELGSPRIQDEHEAPLVRALRRLLRDPGCRLRALYAAANEFTVASTRRLLAAAATCHTLTHLDVWDNNVDVADVERLRAVRPDMHVRISERPNARAAENHDADAEAEDEAPGAQAHNAAAPLHAPVDDE